MSQQVIFVDETTDVGGAEINMVTIASRLQCHGWSVSVIVPSRGPLSQLLKSSNVPCVHIPRPPFFSTSFYVRHRYKIPNPVAFIASLLSGAIWVLRLYRYLRRRPRAIVHTNSIWAHACAGLAARLAGHAVVWHFQDIVNPRAGFGLYRWMVIFWSLLIPDRIVCISDHVADQFRTVLHAEEQVRVIWNTIDVEAFTPNGRFDAPRQVPPLRIGTVARLTPWKGHEVALETAHLLQARGIPFSWRFAGDESLGVGGYRRHLDETTRRLEVTDAVDFIGWVDDVAAFYQSVDVLVHIPTEPEPFGLVIAEAMAAGLPVITTHGSGAAAFVRASNGVLVPAGEPEPVVDALVEFATNPNLLLERGRDAHIFARETFSTDTYIHQLTTLYTALLDE